MTTKTELQITPDPMTKENTPLVSDEEQQRLLREAAYWLTPEGRAVKRWPADKWNDGRTNLTLTKRNIRQGYARCIKELVEPLEAERSALLRERDELGKDRDNLRNFIENIINNECWGRVEYLEGGDVQDEAVRMEVLVEVPHALPCTEEICGCEGEDVDYLYQFAWHLSTQGSSTNTTPSTLTR